MKERIQDETLIWLFIYILAAYLFSIGIRMYWPFAFAFEHPEMFYNGQLMINTNDGYFYATGAKDILEGFVGEDRKRIAGSLGGLPALTAYLVKFTPFSLETVILYLPALISSLIVIPIILTGHLIRHTLLGFFAALLGSIAVSYYNRTMIGYYDTDMFSVFLQFTIFYSFLHIAYKKDLRSILLASFFIFIYPYFYPQGMTIVYAMFGLFLSYLVFEYKGWVKVSETDDFKEGVISLYGSAILLSIALITSLAIEARLIIFFVALAFLLKVKIEEKSRDEVRIRRSTKVQKGGTK